MNYKTLTKILSEHRTRQESPCPEMRNFVLQAEHPLGFYDHNPDPLEQLPCLGSIPSRNSRDIPASPLGIGFETLDRETFDPKQVIPLLAVSGVKHARCQSGWIRCEISPGHYDFSWLDEVVDGLLAIGVKPWLSLSFGHPFYTPCEKFSDAWAEAAKLGRKPANGMARGYVAQPPIYHGETAVTAWRNYCCALAHHFAGRVDEFEVWNEPEGFWQKNGVWQTPLVGAEQTAKEYVELVRLTSEAVREALPEAKIIANVAHTGTYYITTLGKEGLGKYIDIIAYHVYEHSPEFKLRERTEHLLANLRVPGRNLILWQGESGCWTGEKHPATEYIQAKFLARRFLADLAVGAEMSSFFTAIDFRNYYPDGKDQHYGVINAREMRPKLAFHTLQRMSYLCEGLAPAPDLFNVFTMRHYYTHASMLPFVQTVNLSFRRKGVPLFAVWTPEMATLSATIVYGMLQLVPHAKEELPHPVVIDPLRNKVRAIRFTGEEPGGMKSQFIGALQLDMFPVCDYPLIITDAAIFNELQTHGRSDS